MNKTSQDSNPINVFIHHFTQIASIALAFVWFGWHGAVVAFLINWAGNTHD